VTGTIVAAPHSGTGELTCDIRNNAETWLAWRLLHTTHGHHWKYCIMHVLQFTTHSAGVSPTAGCCQELPPIWAVSWLHQKERSNTQP